METVGGCIPQRRDSGDWSEQLRQRSPTRPLRLGISPACSRAELDGSPASRCGGAASVCSSWYRVCGTLTIGDTVGASSEPCAGASLHQADRVRPRRVDSASGAVVGAAAGTWGVGALWTQQAHPRKRGDGDSGHVARGAVTGGNGCTGLAGQTAHATWSFPWRDVGRTHTTPAHLLVNPDQLPSSESVTVGEAVGQLINVPRFDFFSDDAHRPTTQRFSRCELIPDEVEASRFGGEATAVCWEAYRNVLAVGVDECVHFYVVELGQFKELVLEREGAGNIQSIACNPIVATDLAVAYDKELVLWKRIMNASGTESVHAHVLLNHPGAVQIAYSPCGQYLACGFNNGNVLICDIIRSRKDGTVQSVSTSMPGEIGCLSWSPSGTYLAVGSLQGGFAILDARTMKSQVWSPIGGRSSGVQILAWGPSNQLLVNAVQSSMVSCVLFPSYMEYLSAANINPQDRVFSSAEVLDLKEVHAEEGDAFGGDVEQMAWSPDAQRLAVAFQGCPFIAIFYVRVGSRQIPQFECVGSIRPAEDSRPVCLTFSPSFAEGALLCVLWDDNRVATYPLVYRQS